MCAVISPKVRIGCDRVRHCNQFELLYVSFFIQIILKQPTKVPNQANAADAVNYPADLQRYFHRRIKYAKNVLDKYVLMMHNDACIIAYIWRCGP